MNAKCGGAQWGLIFPLALARPVFELQKCYLDENWSEINQEFIGVVRHGLARLVSKLP